MSEFGPSNTYVRNADKRGKTVHIVVERQGAYLMTPFETFRDADAYCWQQLKLNRKRKFAIVRNRDSKLIKTYNSPNWPELRKLNK